MSVDLVDETTGEIVSLLTRTEARALVDRVKARVDDLRDDLLAMWSGVAWKSLGYESWDAMCEAEFEVRIALPRPERAALVGDLREQGMPLRAIGSALGISNQTAMRDAAGAPNGAPATVTGVDGKQYPATRPSLAVVPPVVTDEDHEFWNDLAEQARANGSLDRMNAERPYGLAVVSLSHAADSILAVRYAPADLAAHVPAYLSEEVERIAQASAYLSALVENIKE